MTRRVLLADMAIAAALVLLVLIVAPGWALVAVIAVPVIFVCAMSLLIEGFRRRRATARSRSTQRPPSAGSRRPRAR